MEANQDVSRGTPSLRFSLRALRRDRLGKLERAAKLDADDIAADPQRSLTFLQMRISFKPFRKPGSWGRCTKFEPRIEQVAMAEAVRKAFSSSAENLLVGWNGRVGKSMAYLVPAALTARANTT